MYFYAMPGRHTLVSEGEMEVERRDSLQESLVAPEVQSPTGQPLLSA